MCKQKKLINKINLINKYKFTERQAEAIVTLQLYRLSSTDITIIQDEIASLKKEIITIKANANGGIYETDEMITVTIINENIDNSTKDIEINSTENVVIKPTTINGKSVTISALTTDTSETNATLVIKATENVSAKNLMVKGSFSSNTNQIYGRKTGTIQGGTDSGSAGRCGNLLLQAG